MSLSVRRLAPALLLALTLPAALQAAVYVPNKSADTNDGVCDSDCSLREAIAAANQNPGVDVILLHAGTYTLTASGPATGNLEIRSDLVLMGDSAGTIIDGGAAGTILAIDGGATVQIQDVTLRNGRSAGAGGAIHNHGDLTLVRTVLTGNSSVAGSSGPGRGGAIASEGTDSSLTLADSTIANNTAQSDGGGLVIGGDANLSNVTITGNRSGNLGGGLYLLASSLAKVSNATIAGNSAALTGGGVFAEISAFIGIAPKVTSSILAGNTATYRPDCSGNLDSSYDLIGNGTGCFGPAGSHNKVGTAASPIDPKLGPLAANGGPTPTLALLAGSPAINAGNPAPPGSSSGACTATDQRGARRPGSSVCDIGAFEATTACVAGGSTLCLNDGRFKVTANWQTSTASGTGTAVPLNGDNGYFWFSDPGSVEVVAKILNNCASNGHYWFFLGGLTNARVDFTITDTQTGQVKTYTSPLGQAFRTLINRVTFACSYTEP
jgi:CSLREA domain-containing protein